MTCWRFSDSTVVKRGSLSKKKKKSKEEKKQEKTNILPFVEVFGTSLPPHFPTEQEQS